MKNTHSASMETNDFNRLIKATRGFVHKNSDGRQIHSWIRLEFCAAESRVTAVAVDGYRLSVEHAMCHGCAEDFVAYVRDTIQLPAKNNAAFELCEKDLMIRCGEFMIGYAQPTGEFLDWQKTLPVEDPAFRIGFNPELLLGALQSAKVSVGGVFKHPVVLEFRGKNDPVLLKTNKDDVKMVLPVRIREE